MKTIFIASDHAGIALKTAIQKNLASGPWTWVDLGPSVPNQSVDYPDYASLVTQKVTADPNALGILVCGSGIGMSIAANKVHGIRAALVENPVAARLSREHNNANVLCLGARFLAPEYGTEIAQTWLSTPFSAAPKHQHRIDKIEALEKS